MSKKISAKRLLVTEGAGAAQGGSSPLTAGSAEPWGPSRGCGDTVNCSEGTGEPGFPRAGAMLRCGGVIKTTASEEEPSRGMGSGLLSSRYSRAQRAARAEPAPSFPWYIKLQQAVCLDETWFSSGFQLPHQFIIKKKSQLRIGSGCQAFHSGAGYRVSSSLSV